MAANDYIRTVNITPLGTSYSWDTPPSWITITQVGNTDDWTITVAANNGAPRNATLTVRHANTSTVDTITVGQAGASVSPTPTPTSGSGAGPTPTPTSGSGAGPTPSLTFATNTTSNNRFVFTPQTLNTVVAYTIVADGETSPTPPSALNTEYVVGENVSGPDVLPQDPNVFNGTYRFTKNFSPINNTNVECDVIGPYGTNDIWYCVILGDTGEISPTPTSGSGAGPTPTPTSGSGAGPTPTPTSVPNPTVSIFPNISGGVAVDSTDNNTFGTVTSNFQTISSYNWSCDSFKFNLTNETSSEVDVTYIGSLDGETATLTVSVMGTNLAGALVNREAEVLLVSDADGGALPPPIR